MLRRFCTVNVQYLTDTVTGSYIVYAVATTLKAEIIELVAERHIRSKA